MLRPFLRTGITLLLLAWIFPIISISNWTTLIFASIILTILNGLIKPILKILFLPVTIVTFGLFSWVINISLLWLTTYLVPGFLIQALIIFGVACSSLMTLVLVSFLISLIQSMLNWLF